MADFDDLDRGDDARLGGGTTFIDMDFNADIEFDPEDSDDEAYILSTSLQVADKESTATNLDELAWKPKNENPFSFDFIFDVDSPLHSNPSNASTTEAPAITHESNISNDVSCICT